MTLLRVCYSTLQIGFQRRVQFVYLQGDEIGKGCFRLGTIMHEFLHGMINCFQKKPQKL